MQHRIFFIIIFSVLSASVSAQKELRDADKLYARLAYADAIPKYRSFISKDSASYEAKVKLADCYRLTGNYDEAEKWYARVVLNNKASDLDRFHYGQMLMNNGKYTEARKWLELSHRERPHDERSGNFLTAIDKIESLFADSINYKITSLPFNSKGNDFSPVFYKDGIVFTSSDANVPHSKTHSWTGQSFTKLFYADEKVTVPFAKEIQVKFNNGPAAFASEKEVFSTTNILKVNDSKAGIYKLNIIYSVFNGKSWSKPVNFKYNSPQHNLAHPSLSSDGKRLYFSSDMPGGEGGMDLYYCERTTDGWGAPVNLGKEVNTPGNEVFPNIHADGNLYFASNGHEGIGGLDVLVTAFNSAWQKPVALPYPVNTPYDDFGFILKEDKTFGYFSSNRPGGKGGDDIYSFTFTASYIKGIVLNGDTKALLPNTTVTLVDKTTGLVKTVMSDDKGEFTAQVSACRKYEVRAVNENYSEDKEMTLQASCSSPQAGTLEIVFNNPTLKFDVTDKYLHTVISDATIEISETGTGSKSLLATGKAESFSFKADPCKEYAVLAKKAGLPDVKTYFKTSCIAKDEVVKLQMGLPPVDPLFMGGVVVEENTNITLDSVAIIVYDNMNRAVATITSASDGSFGIAGFRNVQRLVFFRNGYFSVAKVLNVQADKKKLVVEMPKLKLDAIIQLEGIFYDLGKYNIRPDAALVLDNVVKVMQENLSLAIELGAHTDSRGKDESNMSLSDKRAKAAAQYIIDKGIDASRITGKGYGESLLKNRCGNGVKCSEKEHQENRRTEVKVTGY